MKKFLFIIPIFILILFSSCSKDFEFAEIDSNESAILIPLEGDTTQQAKLDSLAFYEQNLISGKRIKIPFHKIAMGDGSSQNVPTHKLIKVSRAPITRLWYNEGSNTGDKRGFATETKSSVGITIGLTLSARIVEPAKFLFFKKSSSDFVKFLDDEVYSSTASIVSEIAASYNESELISSKNEIAKKIQAKLNEVYSKFGVEVYSLGLYGGIIFDNPEIQAAIDETLIQKNKQKSLAAELETAKVRNQLIPYEREWLDIELKKATIKYINEAASKGLNLVPQAYSGDSKGLIFSFTGK